MKVVQEYVSFLTASYTKFVQQNHLGIVLGNEKEPLRIPPKSIVNPMKSNFMYVRGSILALREL